jgi:hypothetical protein
MCPRSPARHRVPAVEGVRRLRYTFGFDRKVVFYPWSMP